MARPRRITASTIRAIDDLREFNSEEWTYLKLAELFQISESTVGKIVKGTYSWDPLDNPDHSGPPSHLGA